jgi:CubicO group peptidase (beta-lactamase class C family)
MKKLVAFIILFSVLSSCHVGRFFIYNFSDIRDYKKFPSIPLNASASPFTFKTALPGTEVNLPSDNQKGKKMPFEHLLHSNGTVAFIIIRHDTVIYEWTRPNYDSASIVPSFSMAKSIVSTMIGIAIGEGKIKSTSEPITNYLKDLDPKKFGNITIQHLLDMQSGLRSIENYYNPFGDVAKYYYGRHLKKYMKHLKVSTASGGDFEYLSLNTQLLAAILENATHQKPSAYLQEKLWTPLGMEFSASWSIDSKKEKTEKAFCCINARALDYAKFGRLFLNKGNWNGKQLVPKDWVETSAYDFSNRNHFLYTNQWWHTRRYYPLVDTLKIKTAYTIDYMNNDKSKPYVTAPAGDFFAQGHLGQFIYVYPKTDIVIVRLGKKEGSVHWPTLMRDIASRNGN